MPTFQRLARFLTLLAGLPLAASAADSKASFSPPTLRATRVEKKKESAAPPALNGKSVERITMREAIEMAMRNNLEVKFDKVGVRIERAKVRFEIGVFDPTFSINMSRESLRRPQNTSDFSSTDQILQAQSIASSNAAIDTTRALNGLPPLDRPTQTIGIPTTIFDQQNDRFSANLIQRTPWGMRYGLFVEANRLRNTFSGDNREITPQYQTSAQIQVVQPLLKDFGPAANLANLRVARLNKQIAVLIWKQRLMTGLQAVMANYYDMTFGLADVGVRQEAITADELLIAQTERRLELGFMSPFDVQQARAQLSLDQEQLISAKNLLMERQFALKRLILDQFNVNDLRIFLPLAEPPLGVPALDRSFFLRQAFAHRPDFRQALTEADSQDIRLRFARNQLLPQLDLVATYGLNGLKGGYGDSFDQTFAGSAPGWTVGVNLRIPLGNIQARAQLDSVKAQKEQAILKIKQSELGIGVDVDTVMSRIETNRQRVETARKTRELYVEAVRIAYRKLEEGQISSFDIIEQQRRLYDSKSREAAARAELDKSITQLWLVTGTMLERLGIQVPEIEKESGIR
ncbi:MAG: TolC family protein [Verrucomicrobiota bacterium]